MDFIIAGVAIACIVFGIIGIICNYPNASNSDKGFPYTRGH